jgi:hypothetical protein
MLWLVAVTRATLAGFVAMFLTLVATVSIYVLALLKKDYNWKVLAGIWGGVTVVVTGICMALFQDHYPFWALMCVLVIAAMSGYCYDIRMLSGKTNGEGQKKFKID